jgi:hypothetical protein
MATTISSVAAAAALQDYFGSRLEANHADGQQRMIDVLRKQFGISVRDARKLVEDLEQARTIRFRPGSQPTPIPGVSPTGSTSVQLPLATISNEGSYWQLEPPA